MIKNVIRFFLFIFAVFLFLSQWYAISSTPVWFGKNDWIVTLYWKSDFFLIDWEWRKTWFIDGKEVEDLPWVTILHTYWWKSISDNSLKQIYMSEARDYKIVVIWKYSEKYSLMIKWKDYYIKLSDVDTTKWQIDRIYPSESEIVVDFDDKKTWDYSLMMNNYKYKDGGFYYHMISATWNQQVYKINWEKLDKKQENAVSYEIYGSININENKLKIAFYLEVVLWIVLLVWSIFLIKFYLKEKKQSQEA